MNEVVYGEVPISIPSKKKRPNQRARFHNWSREGIRFQNRLTAMYKESSWSLFQTNKFIWSIFQTRIFNWSIVDRRNRHGHFSRTLKTFEVFIQFFTRIRQFFIPVSALSLATVMFTQSRYWSSIISQQNGNWCTWNRFLFCMITDSSVSD